MHLLFAAALFMLSAASPAAGQSRETICLHEIGDSVCADLVAWHNTAARHLSALGDSRVQRVCRSAIAEQFHRACAQRILESASADRRCYPLFQRFARSHMRELRLAAFAGIDTQRCFADAGHGSAHIFNQSPDRSNALAAR
jgi:hypothetical protein